jgi:fused signal recognition particle receptor
MTQDLKGQFRKDAEQEKKHTDGEPARLIKEQARREADSAREERIQKEHRAKEAKRAEKQAAEEPARLAKEKARKDADLAKEQAVAKDLEDRKRKAGK